MFRSLLKTRLLSTLLLSVNLFGLGVAHAVEPQSGWPKEIRIGY
ncbi:hypothetical protein RGU70_16695 [Herbaspirillum sp. RTI4]|nr:hypothetical protein [Herbaspirillum sp. RTI4]MDY7579953.1 hypothetical protein [Herbaspirillum sp. RTI4]MEA9982903.1 hypothetical protein [Herbaspirillum sp. RTI4]